MAEYDFSADLVGSNITILVPENAEDPAFWNAWPAGTKMIGGGDEYNLDELPFAIDYGPYVFVYIGKKFSG